MSKALELRHKLQAQRDQFGAVLPPDVSADRFVRIVMTALQGSPDLYNCDPQSVLKAA